PRMLFPESAPELVDAPVFDFRSILPPTSQTGGAVSTRTLLVKLDHQLRHLMTRIDALDRIELADHGYHVRLTTEDDGRVALYHPSGDRIDGGYHPRSPARLLARLSRQVLVPAGRPGTLDRPEARRHRSQVRRAPAARQGPASRWRADPAQGGDGEGPGQAPGCVAFPITTETTVDHKGDDPCDEPWPYLSY
ncbi:MAG: hypothetical protein GY856_49545, partial [bacterium]|nr:hypothetical protein [bacterium]